MHAFQLIHKGAPKTAATTLPIVRRAHTVGIFVANTRERGQDCARQWAASSDRLSASPLQHQNLQRHQRRTFQQQPPQQFIQVKCSRGKAGECCRKVSAEPSEHPNELVSSGAPSSPFQNTEPAGKHTPDGSLCMEGASSNAGSTAHAGPPNAADSWDTSPSEAPSEAQRTLGRRRRCIRVSLATAEASSSVGLPADGMERGVEQLQASNVPVGRRRGRAARNCLKAAAAWLGAVLPQVSSTDASRYSAVAAIAMLARGGRVGRAAFPSSATSDSDAAQQEAGLWQRPCTASQGGKDDPSQPQGPEGSDGVSAGNGVAATDAALDPKTEAMKKPHYPATSPAFGRRQRQRISLGPLGPPATPDATSGGAMDFQFPILFNRAIKRLLKSLFRRTGQPRRQACARTASASTPSPAVAAAVGGIRNVQRPRLPPRVLLRSWRPLSKAQSLVGPRQVVHARQQQLQTLQQHLLQEGSVVSEQLRAATGTQRLQRQPKQQLKNQPEQRPEQQQQQQHEEDYLTTPVDESVATHEQENVLAHVAPHEGPLRTDPAASEPTAVRGPRTPEGLKGTSGSESDDGARDTLPCKADAPAHDQSGQEKQLPQQAKHEQPHKTTAARPAAAQAAATLKKAVGRGSVRAGPARRPFPICFVRQRVNALYGQLRSSLAPYCSTISEWTYRNGNVVVTAGSLLSLTATLMADMRLLRTFNLLAGFCYFSYNWSRRPRLTDAALWNVVFLVLNTVMLWRVHTEHREVSFSSDELDIFQRYFLPAGMSPRQFRRLLRQGSWQTFPQGYVLQQEDNNCETLCFVARGAVEISQGGEVVDTYRGGETGAVLGVEPFLSFVADLRRLSAKRVTHATAGSPETLASHADESPEGLQRSQQTVPPFAVGNESQQAASIGQNQQRQEQQQQGRTKEGEEGTSNVQLMENTKRDEAASARAVIEAGQNAHASRQQQQPARQEPSRKPPQPSFECARQGVCTNAPLGASGGFNGTPDGGEETSSGTGIVAAAADAAASAAAAVRTAAATALLTDAPQAPEAQLPTRSPARASTATALVQGGVSSAAEGARHVAEAAAAAAAAAVAAAADAASLTEASQNRRSGTEKGLQRQPLRERTPSLKGESDDTDAAREKGTVTAPYTATCITETTVFCLDLKELAAFVLREPGNLGFPVVQGLTTLLVNRSRAQAARLAILSYDAFLAGVFADGVVQTGERKMLEEFRRKRAISQTQHEQALARLGWTPEEFERGSQASTGVLSRVAFGLGSFLRGSPESDATADGDVQQRHQANLSGRTHGDEDAFHCALPPLLEDWELVEDERAAPPQPAPGDRRPAAGANAANARNGQGCFGDAVSYVFEVEGT
ncbi:hypothetical protein, conserved [Eimeria brunetti]|uniref:POPDC1-3 domain-containing protein n=1 Tax=Eimeria brunetti TaxID=51314 RepID=U6LDZ8_9EIME|nr:hypothetical protein, conserved [Eimeria brunetti]